MAARQTPPPQGAPRRRPGPVMPNSWIWLVIPATVGVGMVMSAPLPANSSIDYSDFLKLVENKQVSKITIMGRNRVEGELKKEFENDEFVKSKNIKRGSFRTTLPDT